MRPAALPRLLLHLLHCRVLLRWLQSRVLLRLPLQRLWLQLLVRGLLYQSRQPLHRLWLGMLLCRLLRSLLSWQLQLRRLNLLLHLRLLLHVPLRHLVWQRPMRRQFLSLPRGAPLLRWILLLCLLGCHSRSIGRCRCARRIEVLATLCAIIVARCTWRRRSRA